MRIITHALNRQTPHRQTTFADHGIIVPMGTHAHGEIRTNGEIRTKCPRCSPHRKKQNIRCLAVNTAKGTWHCHHCLWSGSLHQGSQRYLSPPPPLPTETALAQSRRLHKLRTTWKAAFPLDHPEAEPARVYLSHRGLKAILHDLPADLRLHPALPYWEQDDRGQWVKTGEFPALLALVRSPDGTAVSLHRTYLKIDGRGKAAVISPKKLMTPIVPGSLKGAAVRLYPATEQLAAAEGIETALAIRVGTGLPTWSALFKDGLAQMAVPESLTEIFIGADNDASRAGELAAYTLARRLKKARPALSVKVALPDKVGTDWLDELLAEQGQGHG